jgi:hypothetical protein
MRRKRGCIVGTGHVAGTIVCIALASMAWLMNRPISTVITKYSSRPSAVFKRLPLCDKVIQHRDAVLKRWSADPTSSVCDTFSANFPSLGGPGCPCPCTINDSMSAASVYWSDIYTWPPELLDRSSAAVELLQTFGPLIHSDAAADPAKSKLRLVFSYHCCVGKPNWPTIKSVADAYPWRPIRVFLTRLTCIISDSFGTVSLVLPLDVESSTLLEDEAAHYEVALDSRGISQIPHSRLQAHHITLATVNASLFRVADAITAVNARFPVWSDSGIVLERARCHRCDTLVARQSAKKLPKNPQSKR